MNIKDFEEELGISRVGAIFRLFAAFIIAVCFISEIVIAAINFPYKKNYSLDVFIPKGNYQVVKYINGLTVGLDKEQFFNVALADKILVFWGKNQNMVTFSSIKEGVIFYYDKKIEVKKFSFLYKIRKIEISGTTLNIEMERYFLPLLFVSIGWLVTQLVLICLFLRTLMN